MKEAKKPSLAKYLTDEIFDIDENTGLQNAQVMAKHIIAIAKGEKGGAREQIAAFQLAVDRVDGKVKEEIGTLFFDQYPKAEEHIIEKYKQKHNYTFAETIEDILGGTGCPN